jgi:hypothetical protein
MSIYNYVPHPRHEQRKTEGPVKSVDVIQKNNKFQRFNARLGLRITTIVGTMICAYVFILLAVYGLPTAIKAGPSGLVLWCSSEFLQLVLLPIIIVGQNIQSKASDARAAQTYNDAEAILHEATELQKHLMAQDEVLSKITGGK